MADRLLGLRVASRGGTAAATLALFAVYWVTMSRSLSLYDSPELALVAEQLGLGHPFGQPLHTLIGGLLTRVPGVDPLVALNGLSALAGALTVVPASSLAEAAMRSRASSVDPRFVAPTIAILGAHPVLWETATRIEVYPLAVSFALWGTARFAEAAVDRESRALPYVATGLSLGLAASANPVCAVGAAVAMAPRLVTGAVRRDFPRLAVGSIVAGGLLGLLPYLYVFAVASRQDVVVWGAPVDAASVRHYFTAADFTYKTVASWSEWWGHLGETLVWTLRNGLFAVFLAGLTGYALFLRTSALGLSFLGLAVVFFSAFVARSAMFAPDLLDQNGYLAIPIWIAAAGAGLFVADLAGRQPWYATSALALFALLVILMPPSPPARTRHLDTFTRDIGLEALRAAPRDAIVIVSQDHWIGPMWYLQERERVRPDVVLLAHGLAASEWYWHLLYRRHPDLDAIELRAPGGRIARIRRFLAANSARPVQVESVALAHRLGLPTCASDWLLDVRSSCGPSAKEPSLARYAGASLAELRSGSPGTDGLIALVTLDRGHDLYAQGFPRTAIETLLEGVPGSEERVYLDLSALPARIEPLVRPQPVYEPHVALGDPSQNLHYASVIAKAVGASELAVYFREWSDAKGPVQPKFTPLPATPDTL